MNESLGLGECKELEYFCWKNICDRLSFKAIDSHGKCLGVVINGICDRESGDGQADDDSIYRKHEKFYRIIKLTEALDRQVNIFGRHSNINSYVEGKVLSVDGDYRGLGIACQLIRRTLDEIGVRNLPLMVIQCSSFYSAKVMIKMGFSKIASIRYEDFYLDGRQAMAPKDPHKEITAFVKWTSALTPQPSINHCFSR